MKPLQKNRITAAAGGEIATGQLYDLPPRRADNRSTRPGISVDGTSYPSPGDEYPFIPGMEIPGRTYNGSLDAIRLGFQRGYNYGVDPKKTYPRSKSIFTDRAPASQYDFLPPEGNAAFAAGRIAADVTGHGSRSFIWGAHPEDMMSTLGNTVLGDIPKQYKLPIMFAAASGMGIASGNYNPLNFEGGGASAGFEAISNDGEAKTVSTAPIYDLAIERGVFGRKGRLLGWDEFKQHRPDVSYQEYENYRNYLFNKDENFLRDISLGLVKTTGDGINGPEASIMGYSVTPMGLATGLAILGSGKYLSRKANLI